MAAGVRLTDGLADSATEAPNCFRRLVHALTAEYERLEAEVHHLRRTSSSPLSASLTTAGKMPPVPQSLGSPSRACSPLAETLSQGIAHIPTIADATGSAPPKAARDPWRATQQPDNSSVALPSVAASTLEKTSSFGPDLDSVEVAMEAPPSPVSVLQPLPLHNAIVELDAVMVDAPLEPYSCSSGMNRHQGGAQAPMNGARHGPRQSIAIRDTSEVASAVRRSVGSLKEKERQSSSKGQAHMLLEKVTDAIRFAGTWKREGFKFAMREWRKPADDRFNSRLPIFPDPDIMKEEIRRKTSTHTVEFKTFYHDSGVGQCIARHPVFDNITMIVIMLNAVWIAVDTDQNKEDLLVNAEWPFQFAEHSFCAYFAFEIGTRFSAFKRKRHCFKDTWFIFDAALVIMGIVDTWFLYFLTLIVSMEEKENSLAGDAVLLRVARIVRITRMCRIMRLLRSWPELIILVKGMMSVARTVFFTMLLLGIIIYVFAIAFTQSLQGTEVGAEHFPNVPLSMHTLWIYGTLLDETSHLMVGLVQAGWTFVIVFDIFILVAALTVMNMLIGLLVWVVSAVAQSEKEDIMMSQATAQMRRLLGLSSPNQSPESVIDDQVSKEDFMSILAEEETCFVLQNLGVDPVVLVDFVDEMFDLYMHNDSLTNRKTISFPELMEAIAQFRGSNAATVKDVFDMRKLLKILQDAHFQQLRHMRIEAVDQKAEIRDMREMLQEAVLLLVKDQKQASPRQTEPAPVTRSPISSLMAGALVPDKDFPTMPAALPAAAPLANSCAPAVAAATVQQANIPREFFLPAEEARCQRQRELPPPQGELPAEPQPPVEPLFAQLPFVPFPQAKQGAHQYTVSAETHQTFAQGSQAEDSAAELRSQSIQHVPTRFHTRMPALACTGMKPTSKPTDTNSWKSTDMVPGDGTAGLDGCTHLSSPA